MRTKEIKAIALMLMLPLLVLTACSSSSDSSDVVVPQHAIGFSGIFADNEGGTTSAPATRGVGDGEFTNTELQASGFGVYCWYTGSDDFVSPLTEGTTILMMNQHVTYNNTDLWHYTPSKYWPLNNQEKLTFRAYAPYVSYQLQTDANGMPLLPVVVKATDYHDGTQHDPLWGTGKLLQGNSDPVPGEYAAGTTYGLLYDNIKYEMSGDYRLANASETKNGTINWYFHHGMARLIFKCSVIQNPGCDKVTIRSIKIENLNTQGLLSLSSPTASSSVTEKPIWTNTSGNMTVTLSEATQDNTVAGDLAPIPTPEEPVPAGFNPYPFVITTSTTQATTPIDLLEHGLLIIPRNFSSPNLPLKVTISYTVDTDTNPLEAEGTITQEIYGNTSYTLKLSLTPSTKGLEITLVQSAFTPWNPAGSGEREVYNW